MLQNNAVALCMKLCAMVHVHTVLATESIVGLKVDIKAVPKVIL